jgi:hypothetical protein
MPALGAIPEPASVAVAAHAAETDGVHGISAYGATLTSAVDAMAARIMLELGSAAVEDETVFTRTLGRSGGQAQHGGTGAGENLTLQSTTHATRGVVESLDPLVVPAGTTLLAGLRHSGMAANTGWYAINANNLSLLITGAERYRFGSAGHFGAAAGVTVGNSPSNPHAALMGISAGVARITTNNFSTRGKLEVADFDASGTAIALTALPTIDPGVAGRLWRDGTTLKVSI